METIFTGFVDRADAGYRLAKALSVYAQHKDAVVLGLSRGGVMTAAALALQLELSLDVLDVVKLMLPGEDDLAFGAVAPGGIRVVNARILSACAVTDREVDEVETRARAELARREVTFRAATSRVELADRIVIVVDDGLATGATMAAAITAVLRAGPKKVVLAVPVALAETLERFRLLVDEVAFLETPEPFGAIGYWYVDFAQVTDDDVVGALVYVREKEATGSKSGAGELTFGKAKW